MLSFDLLNSFISWRMKKRFHQIELFMKYPDEVQSEWLVHLLRSASQTKYGKEYDFASINSYAEFASRVPIVDYEGFSPLIERVRQGEQNLIWPSEILWFAKSSGTTDAQSKFIPVSRESLEDCHFKGGKDLLSLYCNANPETRIFTGKGLRLGGSTRLNSQENESFYGDLSAIIIENLPFWVTMLRTPNNKISLMDEWESKIEAIAQSTIKEDVTSLAGVPSWMLVLSKRILEITGANHLKEVWPNLELYLHGGVSFAPYKKQFQNIIPQENFHFFETYNASEGFFGIQDRAHSDDMLLMLDYGIFYEFIPLSLPKKEEKVIPLIEVELGVNYAMIITTNGGLWRYKIGDTVQFTSIHPFRIKITGRTKHFINAFGEELIIENADRAIEKACDECKCNIREYTAGPVYMNEGKAGTHEWIIEFNTAPDSLKQFTHILDNELKKLNTDYEAKRYKDMALSLPIVHIAPKDTFHRWMKLNGKLGGQNKVPRLANHRDFLEEILPILKENNDSTI